MQEIAAPELVKAIEANDFEEAAKIVKKYAEQFDKIDSLILGCTHYPLVKEFFKRELPNVNIISQDELMGKKLQDYLSRHIEIDITLSRDSRYNFLVSQFNEHYHNVARTMFPDIPITEV